MDIRNKVVGTQTIRVSVLYFAQLREVTGVSNEIVPLIINSTLGELITRIEAIHPRILEVTFQVAVNRRVAGRKLHLGDLDEIAVFPPVTGG